MTIYLVTDDRQQPIGYIQGSTKAKALKKLNKNSQFEFDTEYLEAIKKLA